MTGSWWHRSAYHHRLVGYGDFLRRTKPPAAGSQSVAGGPSGVVDAPRAADAAAADAVAGLTSQEMGALVATHGGNPSLGMGLADVAELATESTTAHSKGSDSAAGGDTQRTTTTKQPRHSCKCGICDACTALPSRQPAKICHHVACISLAECTILPGYKPYRHVNPDSRRTARISWLPTNFWSKTGQLSQSEQVSQIASSFELDRDQELISDMTATIRGGMESLLRQQNRRFHQRSVERTLENTEGLLNAGMLDERSPFYDLFASRINQESDQARATSSQDAQDKKDEEDAAMLRFRLLLDCMAEIDKMIADGRITEAEKDQAMLDMIPKTMKAFDESQKLLKQRCCPKTRTQPWTDKWAKSETARVRKKKETAELVMARNTSGIPMAAYGREPKIRSRLASEVWIADPVDTDETPIVGHEDEQRITEPFASLTLAHADQDSEGPDTDIYGVSDDSDTDTEADIEQKTVTDAEQDSARFNSDDGNSDSDDSDCQAQIDAAERSGQDDDDDSDEEEVILFKGRRRA